jgi:hypothetical protein
MHNTWEGREMHKGLWWVSQKEIDLDVDGRITLKWILEKGWGGMGWIHLA